MKLTTNSHGQVSQTGGFTSLRSLFASSRQECAGFKRYRDISMIVSSSSLVVAGSVWVRKRSTSAPSLLARRSVSRKFRMTFGWSASWTMIWGTSMWRPECWNLSTTRSARGCHLCSRNVLSPMSPGRTRLTWWAVQDSNLRPPACKAGALTS